MRAGESIDNGCTGRAGQRNPGKLFLGVGILFGGMRFRYFLENSFIEMNVCEPCSLTNGDGSHV